jgi:DNA repair protein RadC
MIELIENRKPNRHHIEALIGERSAEKLYNHFSDENSILYANEDELILAGIPTKAAKMMIAARNIKEESETFKIRSSMDAYTKLKFIGTCEIEHFLIMPLNRANIVLGIKTVSVGGTSGTVVDAKILFRMLLNFKRINGFIVAHNHPSGNITESEADVELTKKLIEGAKLLDMKLFDHLIITSNGYKSFADSGLM